MGKVLILISVCFFYPSAFSHCGKCTDNLGLGDGGTGGQPLSTGAEEQWQGDRSKFTTNYENLPALAREVISHCDGGADWINNLQKLTTENQYITSLKGCFSKIESLYKRESLMAAKLSFELDPQSAYGDKWKEIFPEHQQSIQDLSNKWEQYMSSVSQPKTSSGRGRGRMTSIADQTGIVLLSSSLGIGFVKEVEQDSFMTERKSVLANYECDNQDVSRCHRQVIEQQYSGDVDCLKKAGFEKCRPFLEGSNCQPQAVVALASELSKDDKGSMAYVCWKAAAQGAQCCINPDQCPTDGAFRNIASQLQKAAPGLVKAFAGLEAIKGNYQEACQANLLANAAGPLSQLQTKTCGDSATACEETCDKRVQEFKESFKKAVLGGQPQGKKQEEKPLTIDGIVEAAKAIHPDKEAIPDTEEEAKEIKSCSEAVAYLDKVFGKKEDDKKTAKLSEKLSHASLVDCDEEIFKYSGGNSSGGANPASGLGGMNPMAAQMCRQGHPDGPLPPRLPVVGPTPNPGMGPGHLFGSKTRPGPRGNFTAPGAGAPPPEEFIEPERGPAGANALNGGWTDTGSGMGPGGSSGPGGSGLPGSPSRDDEGGSGDTGDNLPIAYPEAFDSGGGGFDSGGGDMGSEGSPLMQMAKYMEKKDTEEARKKEEERLKEIDAQGSIFNRLSQTIRAYCQQENCPEE